MRYGNMMAIVTRMNDRVRVGPGNGEKRRLGKKKHKAMRYVAAFERARNAVAVRRVTAFLRSVTEMLATNASVDRWQDVAYLRYT